MISIIVALAGLGIGIFLGYHMPITYKNQFCGKQFGYKLSKNKSARFICGLDNFVCSNCRGVKK